MTPSVNCNYSYRGSVFDWNCDSHRSGGRVKYHLNIRASKPFGFIVQQLVLAIFDLQDGNKHYVMILTWDQMVCEC